jgi:hypothetical protein
VQIREYKYKKILRQCSILAVNFWSLTYFGVFNFGTSYLGAKIGQNKTMTKLSRFTVSGSSTRVFSNSKESSGRPIIGLSSPKEKQNSSKRSLSKASSGIL